MTSLAPIVLFVYNRPEHTRRTVEALAKNELAAESDLIIYSDGAKDDAGAAKVKAVRDYLHTVAGFKSIAINEKEKNCGLANSIIAGVAEVVNKYGTVIALEDDMVTSPYFLRYMNDALEMYRDEEQVISIHGYIFPMKVDLPDTFFLSNPGCWGWATWKRGWYLFEQDGRKLLAEIKKRHCQKRFNYDNSFPFYKMLKDQVKGKVDSWAIRWYASAFVNNKLTLWPGKSLIKNIGIDQSGTHCQDSHAFDVDLSSNSIVLIKISPAESEFNRDANIAYFRTIKIPFLRRIKNKATIEVIRLLKVIFRRRI